MSLGFMKISSVCLSCAVLSAIASGQAQKVSSVLSISEGSEDLILPISRALNEFSQSAQDGEELEKLVKILNKNGGNYQGLYQATLEHSSVQYGFVDNGPDWPRGYEARVFKLCQYFLGEGLNRVDDPRQKREERIRAALMLSSGLGIQYSDPILHVALNADNFQDAGELTSDQINSLRAIHDQNQKPLAFFISPEIINALSSIDDIINQPNQAITKDMLDKSVTAFAHLLPLAGDDLTLMREFCHNLCVLRLVVAHRDKTLLPIIDDNIIQWRKSAQDPLAKKWLGDVLKAEGAPRNVPLITRISR